MTDSQCIFCKIANGEIPSTTLYEDDSFRAIFDISPASKGHAIILPKNHAKDICELSKEDGEKIFLVAQKVAKGLKKATGCDGINILQNNGEAAGQTVFHLHVHVIPRYQDDKVTIGWEHGEANQEELEKIVEAMKAE